MTDCFPTQARAVRLLSSLVASPFVAEGEAMVARGADGAAYRVERDGVVAVVAGKLAIVVDVWAARVRLRVVGPPPSLVTLASARTVLAAAAALLPFQEGTLPCEGLRLAGGALSTLPTLSQSVVRHAFASFAPRARGEAAR